MSCQFFMSNVAWPDKLSTADQCKKVQFSQRTTADGGCEVFEDPSIALTRHETVVAPVKQEDPDHCAGSSDFDEPL